MSRAPIDQSLLRRALGAFVTGVTVVTTRSAAGEPVGLTVNSFNTVSLDPPLILWSIALRAASYDAFVQSDHFAVNVLAADQIALSESFARTGGDKFASVPWHSALAEMPLLQGTAASFVCRNAHRFPGGDHQIIVGEIVAFQRNERAPLVYANGGYANLSDDIESVSKPAKVIS